MSRHSSKLPTVPLSPTVHRRLVDAAYRRVIGKDANIEEVMAMIAETAIVEYLDKHKESP